MAGIINAKACEQEEFRLFGGNERRQALEPGMPTQEKLEK
jgi:hypothetical protein